MPGSPWQEAREHRDRRGFEPVAEREAEHRSARRGRLARREEGEYRDYSTDEQRGQPG